MLNYDQWFEKKQIWRETNTLDYEWVKVDLGYK